jgi:hypothetical protein
VSTIAHLPGGVKLSINENDHNPPHLHLECPEGRFRVFFHDLSVQTIVGSQTKARKEIAEVQTWMSARVEVLRERWAAKERKEGILPAD